MARTVDVTIERLAAEGEGVARLNGRSVFVPGGFPGDQVRVQVEDGPVLRGNVLARLEDGPGRREVPCPIAGPCGGCDWMGYDAGLQRTARLQIVRSALELLGGVDLAGIEQRLTLHPGPEVGTRRRAVLHWGEGGLGYFGRRTHTLVPVERCLALSPPLDDWPGRLTPLLRGIGPDLDRVHLLAEGDQVAVALQLKATLRERHRAAAAAVHRGGARGVVLVEAGGRAEDVGRPTLRAPAALRPGAFLRLRPEAFSQAHAEATPALVGAALEALHGSGHDRVLELFAGNGLFTLALAARCASVLAVESTAVSVGLLRQSADEARIPNVRAVLGDAASVCEGLAVEGARFDLLLADPPRTGAPGLAGWAVALGVGRVVYVGCDAGALARDAGALVRAGFRLASLQLVDMFPQTHHVEAVVGFCR